MSKHASVFILRVYTIKKPQLILVVFKNFSQTTKNNVSFTLKKNYPKPEASGKAFDQNDKEAPF